MILWYDDIKREIRVFLPKMSQYWNIRKTFTILFERQVGKDLLELEQSWFREIALCHSSVPGESVPLCYSKKQNWLHLKLERGFSVLIQMKKTWKLVYIILRDLHLSLPNAMWFYHFQFVFILQTCVFKCKQYFIFESYFDRAVSKLCERKKHSVPINKTAVVTLLVMWRYPSAQCSTLERSRTSCV